MGYAQQNKIANDKQETKENFQPQAEDASMLPSEKGLQKGVVSKSEAPPQGNLIPGTSDIELIKSTIPDMEQKTPHSAVSKKQLTDCPIPQHWK